MEGYDLEDPDSVCCNVSYLNPLEFPRNQIYDAGAMYRVTTLMRQAQSLPSEKPAPLLLKFICIPASVQVICKSCFSDCQSLINVSFESGSRLCSIEEHVFSGC
jgi:hypothetical protein